MNISMDVLKRATAALEIAKNLPPSKDLGTDAWMQIMNSYCEVKSYIDFISAETNASTVKVTA